MGAGGQRHAPEALPPGKTQYPSNRRLRGPQGRSGRVRKISPLTTIRSPDRPVRSESLYRLSYPDPRVHPVQNTMERSERLHDASYPTMVYWRCHIANKHHDHVSRHREYHQGAIGLVWYLFEVGVRVQVTLKLAVSRSVRFGIKPSCTESCCLFELPLWRQFGPLLCLKSPSLSDVFKYIHTFIWLFSVCNTDYVHNTAYTVHTDSTYPDLRYRLLRPKTDVYTKSLTSVLLAQVRAGEPIRGRVSKSSINFEESISRAHGIFEQQNMVLEPSIILIKHRIIIIIIIIIINAHYHCNCIINAQYNHYINF
jgi:hypothetical protein